MNNLVVAPLLLPLLTAIALLFVRSSITLQRRISLSGAVLNAAAAALLVGQVRGGGIQTLYMGGWQPPYGIVFVADMLAALLVLVAALAAIACLLYASRTVGEPRERMHVYPLLHFLLAGVYGSFLTGDLFNLFVCFEVMLISSYALIVLGGTKRQLRETFKYILVNILSSALFVAAVAYLYGEVGTLNMAHLSQRVAEAGQGGMLNVIAVLFMIVFALKAGLFLFFWLPGSYGAPPSAIRVVFAALLTKVGLYALIRTFSLIFYHNPDVTHMWLGLMAGATMALGSIGAIAYRDVPRALNYQVVIGIGFIGYGVALATGDAWSGVVFYMLHDILAKALLFILGGMLIAAAGTEKLDGMGGLIGRFPLIGWLLLGASLAIVGIPPLSGFPGKVALIGAGLQQGAYVLAALGLLSSLAALYALLRLFRQAFWGEEREPEAVGRQERRERLAVREKAGREKAAEGAVAESVEAQPRESRLPGAVAVSLFAALLLLGVCAEWVYGFVSQAGETLARPDIYIEAVIKE